MAFLTTRDYDQLEAAVRDRRRLAIIRQGREVVVVPLRLFLRDGREIIEARHPTTGDLLTFVVEDVDGIEFIR
jgi:hypothetical protein